MKIFTRAAFMCVLVLAAAFAKAVPPNWQVQPNVPFYQNTMSVVAVLNIAGIESVDDNDMVAVFSGGTCRGVAYANTAPVSRHYAFLTIYSNASANEDLTFQIYDASADVVYYATPDTVFENNGILGTINDPFVISTATPVGIGEEASAVPHVFPNPFIDNINIALPGEGTKQVEIHDLAGRLIYSAETEANAFTWNGKDLEDNTIAAGLYILNLHHNHTNTNYPIIKNPL